MLAAMQYKNFVWPNNPETYAISYARQTAVHKLPMGYYTIEDLGQNCRRMEGSGAFYGENAYRTFQKLACVFYDSGPGTLIHPLWQSAKVYFTDLRLAQEPQENYVAYQFSFLEAPLVVQTLDAPDLTNLYANTAALANGSVQSGYGTGGSASGASSSPPAASGAIGGALPIIFANAVISGAIGGALDRSSAVIGAGDSMWSVSRRYGVPMATLMALNSNLSSPNDVKPGLEVRLC